jgi:gliding motility-associated-like protein
MMSSMRILAVVTLGLGLLSGVHAQVPFITSMDKTSAQTQETVTLQGINFGTNAANVKVTFGGTSASPATISDQLIEVPLPAGATFDNVRVTNTATGLSGFSGEFLAPGHGGENPFRVAATSTQADFDTEDGLYDLAMADLDGDGKADIATASDNSNGVSIFRNTSTAGTVSFVKTLLNVGGKTLHVTAGDLNGDGKPDLMLSQVNAPIVYIFRNTSTPGTITFVGSTVTLTGSKASSIRVADIDMNGKPDLVVTDQSTPRVFVVSNQSSLASISFAAPQAVTIPGTTGTDGVATGDLDGDGFPDIVVSEFLNANGKLFILKNESAPGIINFKVTSMDVASTISNLRIGDLDRDGKADVAGTLLLSSRIFVLGNQSTATEIKFAAPALVDADEKPWGIDFGDVDGDGKTDIVVASITSKSITILNNQSSAGAFSFVKTTKVTTFINRYPKIGDLDNDGRPDFAFTSINDNNTGVKASKISVVRNLNCIVPEISPPGPLTICDSFTQRLDASFAGGATYAWFRDGVSAGTGSFLNVTQGGTYFVSLLTEGGSCEKTSAGVVVTVITGAPSGTATPAPVSPVCVGGTLNLTVNDVGATTYKWTGPAGFSGTGLSVSRPAFVADFAGVYELEVMVGTCVAQRESVVVDIVSLPDPEIMYAGDDIICAGQTKELSVFPIPAGYTYQWEKIPGGAIAGATAATYTVTATGTYQAKLKSVASPSCPQLTVPAKRIRIATIPVVNFTHPTTSCIGRVVDFVNTSVVDNDPLDTEVNYAWTFGDGQTANTNNASHTYAAAQNFNVGLTVSYRGNTCPASKQSVIGIIAAPVLEITFPPGVFGLCPGSSVILQVKDEFTSYKWSNGSKVHATIVTKPGIYSVEVTTLGCTLTDTYDLKELPAPVIVVSADPPTIGLGESTELLVEGLFEQFWSPGKSLSDSTVANPTATPLETTTYRVTGKDDMLCTASDTVEVTVIPENFLSLLHPSDMLTPNGDGSNDYWMVERIDIFAQCSVTIYDERGLMVFQATPYFNDWNGISSNGKMLPAGVYYYVIRCGEPGETPLTGSITMVR